METPCEKLLGIHLSNDLSWDNHVTHVKSSLNQGIGMLRTLAYTIPPNYLRQLAQGLVLSKLRYGLSIYGTVRLSETDQESGQMRMLEVAVNDTMRVIERKNRRDLIPIANLRASTKIPSANQMAVQAITMEAWKIQNELSPAIADLMTPVRSTGIVTRAVMDRDVHVPYGGRVSRQSFHHQAAMLWNNAPKDIRECKKKTSVKNKIRSYSSLFP